jgi:hypothetical protein
VQCFLGWLGTATPANPAPQPGGGPENSLTVFGDTGETLCEYGAVSTFMEYLAGRFGPGLMSALHREPENGLAALDRVLERFRVRATPTELIRDWAAMLAVDGALDAGGRLKGGDRPRRLRTPTLAASVNWGSEGAYAAPGAPPNGSDYVRLRGAGGAFLRASRLESLVFDAGDTLPPRPLRWSVVDGALSSGTGEGVDRAIVREVAVPAADPTLTFASGHTFEDGFDFGFVQVSTDGGRTYASLANAHTTETADPHASPAIAASLPGFTGDSGGSRPETFDLSAYAGRTIVLAFRYVTDPAGPSGPWVVDDVRVGGEVVSDGSSLAGWQTPTAYLPTPVAGFTVQLVGIESGRNGDVSVATLPLGPGFRRVLDRRELRRLVGTRADLVGAIVTHDDPTGVGDRPAPYALTVNGVLQPGGE